MSPDSDQRDHILLLMNAREAQHFTDLLSDANHDLTFSHVETVPDMEKALMGQQDQRLRLISFCASVIVPEHILHATDAGAYNFHPGPPSYPGSCAANFAIYNAETYFGATLHEMEKRVDEGKIIDLISFDLPPGMDATDLSRTTYKTLLTLGERHAKTLANLTQPLAPIDVPWAGVKTTKADAKALSQLTGELDDDEKARRSRAFGNL